MICRAKLTGRMGRQSGCYCAFSSSNILIHLYILNIQANFCSVAIYIHTYAIQLSFFLLQSTFHSKSISIKIQFIIGQCLFDNLFLPYISLHSWNCTKHTKREPRKFGLLLHFRNSLSRDSILNYLIRSVL